MPPSSMLSWMAVRDLSLVGERGLFAPALLVARPALTGFVPQPLI
jgi:hypothetical protein